MKTLLSIIFVTMLTISAAQAGGFGIGVFASDTDFDDCCADASVTKDDESAGLYIEHTRGAGIVYGGEIFYANGRGGLTFKAGADVLLGRLTAGAGWYDDELTKPVDVAGVFVTDTNSSFVPVYYVEYEFSGFFVRASRLDSSIDLSATRQTGTDGFGNPVYSTTRETVDTADNWLWAGYRLSF